MWVVERAPAPIVYETLHLPHIVAPPSGGSVLNVLTIPPDAAWQGQVGEAEVAAWFGSVGCPGASRFGPAAPHPYMQQTPTIDFCFVLGGELVLVLDTEEGTVRAGEMVVKRGTSHAWSNRSDGAAVIAIASHDAR